MTWLGTLKDFKDDEWNPILSTTYTYLPHEKKKSCSSSTSSSMPTLAESEEDSIATFVHARKWLVCFHFLLS